VCNTGNGPARKTGIADESIVGFELRFPPRPRDTALRSTTTLSIGRRSDLLNALEGFEQPEEWGWDWDWGWEIPGGFRFGASRQFRASSCFAFPCSASGIESNAA
jgi:hypothetical protein